MEDPGIWDNPAEAQKLGKEKVSLEKIVDTIETVCSGVEGVSEMLDLAADENDQDWHMWNTTCSDHLVQKDYRWYYDLNLSFCLEFGLVVTSFQTLAATAFALTRPKEM